MKFVKHSTFSDCEFESTAVWNVVGYCNNSGYHYLSVTDVMSVRLIQDHSNEAVQLGVTSQGLAVFQNHIKTNTFIW